MKLYVCRRMKKDGSGKYLLLEARADWGTVRITYDVATILELLPYGVDHKNLDEVGECIGELFG